MESKLPQAIESEELVLGSIMSRNAYQEVADIVDVECFYSNINKEIYVAVKKILDDGNTPDFIMVAQAVPHELMASVLTISQKYTFDVRQHALLIKEKDMLRKMINVARKIELSALANDDVLDIMNQANDDLSSIFDNAQTEVITMPNALELMRDNINKNTSNENKLTGFSTGFSEFDKRSGGVQKGDLVVIAAESSQGKTSLALSISKHMLEFDTKIAFYSLEMSAIQIASRLTSISTGIPSNKILYSKLTYDDFHRIDSSLASLSNHKMFIDERSTASLDSILASTRSMKAKFDIDGIVVDYLQIIPQNEKGKTDEQMLAVIARKLKNIAKELNIFVIAISQLSRDNQNPKPSLSRLRGSGQIVEASDIVMLIYRPSYYNKRYDDEFSVYEPEGTAMIDVAKGRNIGVFKFMLNFDSSRTYFYQGDIPHIGITQNQNDPF